MPCRGPAAGRHGPDADQLRARRRDGLAPDGRKPAPRRASRRSPLCHPGGPGRTKAADREHGSGRALRPHQATPRCHRQAGGTGSSVAHERRRPGAVSADGEHGAAIGWQRTSVAAGPRHAPDHGPARPPARAGGRRMLRSLGHCRNREDHLCGCGRNARRLPGWFGVRRFRGRLVARRICAHRAAGWRHAAADPGPCPRTPGATKRRRTTDGTGAHPLHFVSRIRSCPCR